jgi:hypothetical protein
VAATPSDASTRHRRQEVTVFNRTVAHNFGYSIDSENRPVTISNSTFYGNKGEFCGGVYHGGAAGRAVR